jgi:hypothetical protein
VCGDPVEKGRFCALHWKRVVKAFKRGLHRAAREAIARETDSWGVHWLCEPLDSGYELTRWNCGVYHQRYLNAKGRGRYRRRES